MSIWDDPVGLSESERDRLFRSDPMPGTGPGIRGLPTIPADSPLLRKLTGEAAAAAEGAGAGSALGGLLSRIARGEVDLRAALADQALPAPDHAHMTGLGAIIERLHEEGSR